jgi:hypothetical protein
MDTLRISKGNKLWHLIIVMPDGKERMHASGEFEDVLAATREWVDEAILLSERIKNARMQ